jgi:hypothetical protein
MRIVRRLIPRAARDVAKRRLAAWRVDRAIRSLREVEAFSAEELRTFREAWGNEGFSADERFLVEAVRLIKENPGDVLECGTGATTVIAGILAERYGFRVYSLEQDTAWSLHTKRVIGRGKLTSVHILHTPLKSFGNHMWYDTADVSLPRHFGVVLCDGPFIAASLEEPFRSMWRYGVLPFFERSQSTFDTLLLDDVNDARAAAVLAQWQTEFGITQDLIRASEGDCSVIKAQRRC